MARGTVALLAFNRGIISPLALARTDFERLALSAEIQSNWMPRVLGSMMLRPGLKYLGGVKSNLAAKPIPFIFSNSDTSLVEITNTVMRVWDDDVLISRVAVSSAVTNGTFGTDLTGWTDDDETGATSSWATGGYMSLVGTGTDGGEARRTQQVTVSVGDQNKVHALRIVIERGPVTLRVGSTAGADNYIESTELGTGTHSLTFTPTGNFFIRFKSFSRSAVLVDSVAVEASGTMEITAPWLTADLTNLRWDQSGDVLYVACDGHWPRKIERRSATSWSLVKYEPKDGPFLKINASRVTISASATKGDVTLTSSHSFFKSGHVGALFKLLSNGQKKTATITAQDSWTDPIKVTGADGAREFKVRLTGTWVATVTLQYSLGALGDWVDWTTYTANQDPAVSVNDGLDNQIAYYRLGVKTGGFTSGSISATLRFNGGVQVGIARITAFSSDTSVSAALLEELGNKDATENWYEGAWSGQNGYPSAPGLDDGRLWWGGQERILGSVSDAFESFDDENVIGDAGPISRTIGAGPVESISWLKASSALFLGTGGSELRAFASGQDEPMTPTNFQLKPMATHGSTNVDAVKLDRSVLHVEKSGIHIHELFFNEETGTYSSQDLTLLVPEVGEPGIAAMAVQRKPDTRVHCVRDDGKVAVLVFDTAEEIVGWVTVETDGKIEDVAVLPGATEDQVYYVVKRTINGATVRYLEKWAQEGDARGGSTIYSGASTSTITDLNYPDGMVVTVRNSSGTKIENRTVTDRAITLTAPATYAHITPAAYRLADAFLLYSGAATATLTGLSHLEAKSVVVSADGKDRGTFTVAGGQITLAETVQQACIGLVYTSKFKSTKLAYMAELGTAITQKKAVNHIGLVMRDTHMDGIEHGPDFTNMDSLPAIEQGKATENYHVWEDFDMDMMEFIQTWGTDGRLCLRGTAPRPCTVLCAVLDLETRELR